MFLGAWAALLLALRSGRLRLRDSEACQAVVLAFLTLYGLLSAQYLLWAVPLGLLRPGRLAALHAAAASVALVGFYLFLAPGVLLPTVLEAEASRLAGIAWVAGTSATLLVSLAWLGSTLHRARAGAEGC